MSAKDKLVEYLEKRKDQLEESIENEICRLDVVEVFGREVAVLLELQYCLGFQTAINIIKNLDKRDFIKICSRSK